MLNKSTCYWFIIEQLKLQNQEKTKLKMITARKVITVYAELTPNPNSIKFVANQNLLTNGTVEYLQKEDAVDCPLAYQLFDFSGVKSVFITSNFVTITKIKELDWYDITNILREFIKGFLESGEKLFLKSPFEEKSVVDNIAPVNGKEPANNKPETVNPATSPEIEEKIKYMLDEYVRPAVEGDGGAIDFKSFDNGIVTVILKGSCSGCPSSTLTLKAGIENLLKKMVPQVTEVIAESM